MTRSMARSIPSTTQGTSHTREVPARTLGLNLLISLRPDQWTKNLVIFAALIFGKQLADVDSISRVSLAFVAFCMLSGSVYVFNDLVDRERDAQHPIKSARPIASGALAVPHAVLASVLLGISGLALAFWLGSNVGLVAVGYVALQLCYGFVLKHYVILDVLTISIGFVLRALVGGVAIDVPVSDWLLLCTILLALFLALSKRRHELVLLEGQAGDHRPILSEYSPYLLDQMISVVTASTLTAYAFYTMSAETVGKFGDGLVWTLPFPLYGIFRYLYLVHRKHGGGSPSEMLLGDRPLLACVALWVVTVVTLIYRPLG